MDKMEGIYFIDLTNIKQIKWIIDSGATNHTFVSLDFMTEIQKVKKVHDKKIYLPNGALTMVPHVGKYNFGDT